MGNSNSSLYLNTDYRVILVDKIWLIRKLFYQNISIIPMLSKFRGIDASKYKLKKLILTTLYILSFNQESSEIYIYIKCKLYIVKTLKTNILISNNVFYTKRFSIKLVYTFTHIPSCKINIIKSTRHYFEFLKYRILANATTFIPPKFKAFILF